jgi:hypothetical protein
MVPLALAPVTLELPPAVMVADMPRTSDAPPLLSAAHALDAQLTRLEQIRKSHEIEVQAATQHLATVSARLRATTQAPPAPTTTAAPADTSGLLAELQRLTDKVTDLEKLVKIHDEVIKRKVLSINP